jgi:cellulose synthase/poly-beta-1,6-N-acetylglucosamine synthase-like glycosyltransferase
MIETLIALFFVLFSIFSGVYAIYFIYIKAHAKKPWNLKIDNNFQPKISILIPVHDEEDTIESKLVNIKSVAYPKENIEVIVADDASTDKTLMKIEDFMKSNPELNVRTITQNPRSGKSAALNKALNFSTCPIVIVSDADTHWPQNILQNALPYFSDPKVGAITGYGIVENLGQSWVTKGETAYQELSSLIRLGESKMYSTIRFEGGFCGYKREAFEQFDCESGSDDSGTALCVVQNGFRTIFVPEAPFTTRFPDDLKGKIRVKTRRANQLIWLWIKSLRLLFLGRLLLPKKIAVPEIFLFVFNPVIFLALICVMLVTFALYPIFFLPFAIILCLGSIIRTVRLYIIEGTLSNIILFYSLISCVKGKRFVMWNKS